MQAIRNKTKKTAQSSNATSAKRKAVRAKSSNASAKKNSKRSTSSASNKLKGRTTGSKQSFQNKVYEAVSEFAREHNIEEAIKSAMKAMIDKIKL